jgi:hypothetical protein
MNNREKKLLFIRWKNTLKETYAGRSYKISKKSFGVTITFIKPTLLEESWIITPWEIIKKMQNSNGRCAKRPLKRN